MRRLFKDSDDFRCAIDCVRKKFKIKTTYEFWKTDLCKALRASTKARELSLASYMEIGNAFDAEAKKICQDFLMPITFQEIKEYIIYCAQPACCWTGVIKLKNGSISISTRPDITRSEFNEIGDQITRIKKTKVAKNMNSGMQPIQKLKGQMYFDTKLWLQKKRKFKKIVVPEKYANKLKRMNNSIKQRWREEINNWPMVTNNHQ